MLKQAGAWLEGKEQGERVLIDAEDFSRQEAEAILSQLGRKALACRHRGHYDVTLVNTDGSQYFVVVDAEGCIKLPYLRDGRKGRTADSRNVPVHVHCYSEERRRELIK